MKMRRREEAQEVSAEDFGAFDLAVFDSEPSAAQVTGFANAVSVPYSEG